MNNPKLHDVNAGYRQPSVKKASASAGDQSAIDEAVRTLLEQVTMHGQSGQKVSLSVGPMSYTASPEIKIRPAKADELATDLTDKSDMTDEITRSELDARFGEIDAKVDARLAHFESAMNKAVAEIHQELIPLRNIKANIWVAFGLVVALAALGVSLFDSGRETTAAISGAKDQLESASKTLSSATAELQSAQKRLDDTASGRGTVQPPPQPEKP